MAVSRGEINLKLTKLLQYLN